MICKFARAIGTRLGKRSTSVCPPASGAATRCGDSPAVYWSAVTRSAASAPSTGKDDSVGAGRCGPAGLFASQRHTDLLRRYFRAAAKPIGVAWISTSNVIRRTSKTFIVGASRVPCGSAQGNRYAAGSAVAPGGSPQSTSRTSRGWPRRQCESPRSTGGWSWTAPARRPP